MKSKVAEKVVDKAVEVEKAKLRKKAKKRIKTLLFQILWTFFVLTLGLFVGIHWKVFKALLGKGKMPKVPKEHCHKYKFR